MSSPLIKYNNTILVLPPAMCGSIGYYALLASHKNVVIDRECRFDKRRKLMHRYDIADVNGRLTLTVPIVKPRIGATWNDAGVSAHGGWWNIHKVALWSAYGRTPFFEYYIDEFMPYLQPRDGIQPESLLDFNLGIDSIIRRIAGIDSNIRYELSAKEYEKLNNGTPTIKDHRNDDFNLATPVEYYQVRAIQHGFIPNLTILDLIFNMGPETPLVLKKIIDKNL
ncbi:MAG: WbqC family protein [Muribaculaceae bacterium]|nr:WbqC family protein [Muribaculaceae bacterium]